MAGTYVHFCHEFNSEEHTLHEFLYSVLVRRHNDKFNSWFLGFVLSSNSPSLVGQQQIKRVSFYSQVINARN